jgi:hypothetical protein
MFLEYVAPDHPSGDRADENIAWKMFLPEEAGETNTRGDGTHAHLNPLKWSADSDAIALG